MCGSMHRRIIYEMTHVFDVTQRILLILEGVAWAVAG